MDLDTFHQYNHGIDMCLAKWSNKIYDHPYLERDDIRQAAFVKLLKAEEKSSFENRCSLSTWAYKLCDNAIKNMLVMYDSRLDYRKRMWYGEDLWEDAEDINDCPLILEKLLTDSLEDTVVLEEDMALIMDCIGRLPYKQKKCVEFLLEGWPYLDIAQEIGIPIGTAQSAIYRAKVFLTREFKSQPS